MLRVDQAGLRLRFPQARDQLSVLEVVTLLSDLNDLYEITALRVLAGYEEAPIPTQARPRRTSRLIPEDRLNVAHFSYGSELDVLLAVAGGAGSTFAVVKTVPALLREVVDAGDHWHLRKMRRDALHAKLQVERDSHEVELLELTLKRQEVATRAREQASRQEERALRNAPAYDNSGPERPLENVVVDYVEEQITDRVIALAGRPIADIIGDDPDSTTSAPY